MHSTAFEGSGIAAGDALPLDRYWVGAHAWPAKGHDENLD
jgi:hypothetical protein